MASKPPVELRVEVYADGNLDPSVPEQITAYLKERWPITWDVKVPPRASFDRPARWHAVVPYPVGKTLEGLHAEIAQAIGSFDPDHRLRLRTRWDFPESPNEQEIYEARWKPGSP